MLRESKAVVIVSLDVRGYNYRQALALRQAVCTALDFMRWSLIRSNGNPCWNLSTFAQS